MLRVEPKQTSFHTSLYNKIPENHILKTVEQAVDFSFINKLLAKTYSHKMGRPAKEPELMCKLLFLQHLYNLSDERVIEDGNLNLAYMYFLHLNPEEKLPDKSLLSIFRCHRLEDTTLDDIITEIVRQCVEQKIIECGSISIDATHVAANTFNNTVERLMKKIAKKVIKSHQKLDEDFESKYEVPDYETIEDHTESKQVMKTYLDNIIEEMKTTAIPMAQETEDIIKQAEGIVSDPKFIMQKGARSIIDEDARVGMKSKTNRFYGYKTEFIMTTDENIITAVRTENGAYTDGSNTNILLKKTLASGLEVKEVYGDKAYFRKPILDKIVKIKAKAYIPVSGSVYKMDETRFSYNKDADEWSCHLGNTSTEKKCFITKDRGKRRQGYKYYFPKEQCQNCHELQSCAGKRAKRKILNLGLNTAEFYEMSQEQKEAEWIEKYHKRASIESKNAELKRFHGLNRARGYSLRSVSTQAKLAVIAVNIKTIGRLVAK